MGSKSLGEGGWKKDTWMEDNNETQLPSAGERKGYSKWYCLICMAIFGMNFRTPLWAISSQVATAQEVGIRLKINKFFRRRLLLVRTPRAQRSAQQTMR